MIDSFLSIPNAESLPLYRMVLKLACVCVCDKGGREGKTVPEPEGGREREEREERGI